MQNAKVYSQNHQKSHEAGYPLYSERRRRTRRYHIESIADKSASTAQPVIRHSSVAHLSHQRELYAGEGMLQA